MSSARNCQPNMPSLAEALGEYGFPCKTFLSCTKENPLLLLLVSSMWTGHLCPLCSHFNDIADCQLSLSLPLSIFPGVYGTFIISVIVRTILLRENQVLPNLHGVNYGTAQWEKRLPLILVDSELLVVVRNQKMPGKAGLEILYVSIGYIEQETEGVTWAEPLLRLMGTVCCVSMQCVAPAEFEAQAVTALPHNPVGAAECTRDSWNLDTFFPNNDLLYWKKEV